MKFNLLGHPEKLTRDVSIRFKNKKENSELALKFDKEYFDGKREHGYGGYNYDGRWVNVAKSLIKKYNLSSKSKFLDVGCAKGFLMYDLKTLCPGIDVYGVDVSKYAKKNAIKTIKDKIKIGSCDNLEFEDNFFDCTVCINTMHNLDYNGCKKTIKELSRVTKNKKNIFIQVDAYNNQNEKDLFEIWVLTAKTYLMPDEWEKMFRENHFQGDYFWTTIGFSNK